MPVCMMYVSMMHISTPAAAPGKQEQILSRTYFQWEQQQESRSGLFQVQDDDDGIQGYQVHGVDDGGEAEGDHQGQVDAPDVDRHNYHDHLEHMILMLII